MTVELEHGVHLRREALTMALYVSITLIGGALTIAPGEALGDVDVLDRRRGRPSASPLHTSWPSRWRRR